MSARHCVFALALAAASLGTSGCGSSPEPIFFALAPTRGAPQSGLPHAIRIRRLAIPPYLDRPDVVRSVVAYRLKIAPDERWGAPLDEMLGRVLAADLEQRAPGSIAFTEAGAITVDPDATVEIDLERLELDPDGEVVLIADVAIERGQQHTSAASRSIHLHKAPSGTATAALVGTMSDLLGQLSDQVAEMLRSG